MSSLWTPSGEHFPKKEGQDVASGSPSGSRGGPGDVTGPPAGDQADTESEADAQAAVDAMREQLANTPPEIVLANHCYGLFELAAI